MKIEIGTVAGYVVDGSKVLTILWGKKDGELRLVDQARESGITGGLWAKGSRSELLRIASWRLAPTRGAAIAAELRVANGKLERAQAILAEATERIQLLASLAASSTK